MRPVRLTLEGFNSYRQETVIDFSGFEAVAIVGHNGAGKTSLVEGIEFALYGKARDGLDGAVSEGTTFCRVAFEFELGGLRYRVERQRNLSGKGTSSLEFSVLHGTVDGDRWEPAGGVHIAERQAAIEHLLGMNHETWRASSNIAQGGAAAFTNATPADRKRILTEVLQLDRYQAMAEAAKIRARTHEAERDSLRRRREQLQGDLADEGDVRARIASARDGLAEAARRVDAFTDELSTAERVAEQRRADVAQLADTRTRLTDLQQRRRAEQARLEAEVGRTGSEQAAVAREADDVEEQIRRFAASAALLSSLEEQLVTETEAAEGAERESSRFADSAAELNAQAVAANERAAGIATQRREVQESIAVLARAESSCPTCLQPLTEDAHARVSAHLEELAARLSQDHQEALRDVGKHQEAAQRMRARAADRARAARDHRDKVGSLQVNIERSRGAAERLPADRARLADLRAKISGLGGRLDQLRIDLEGFAEPTAEEAELAAALAGAAELDRRASEAAQMVRSARAKLDTARDEHAAASAALARAEEALGALERVQTALSDVDRAITAEDTLVADYSLLHRAFGRDGVQAFVIENAVPVVEDEATRFLAPLMGPSWRIQFQPLRATKGGELRETLDVDVVTDSGIRPLKRLSGGERMAVDLGLRIGLARLLAHRAGTPLQMLIMDEGLTALDEAKRHEAIAVLARVVEEYFVFFVTHDRDLAGAFPTQLQVSYQDGTSTVEVLGAEVAEAVVAA